MATARSRTPRPLLEIFDGALRRAGLDAHTAGVSVVEGGDPDRPPWPRPSTGASRTSSRARGALQIIGARHGISLPLGPVFGVPPGRLQGVFAAAVLTA